MKKIAFGFLGILLCVSVASAKPMPPNHPQAAFNNRPPIENHMKQPPMGIHVKQPPRYHRTHKMVHATYNYYPCYNKGHINFGFNISI